MDGSVTEGPLARTIHGDGKPGRQDCRHCFAGARPAQAGRTHDAPVPGRPSRMFRTAFSGSNGSKSVLIGFVSGQTTYATSVQAGKSQPLGDPPSELFHQQWPMASLLRIDFERRSPKSIGSRISLEPYNGERKHTKRNLSHWCCEYNFGSRAHPLQPFCLPCTWSGSCCWHSFWVGCAVELWCGAALYTPRPTVALTPHLLGC